jgi:hypothetical protein
MNQLTPTNRCPGNTGMQGCAPAADPPSIATPSYAEALVEPAGVFGSPAELVAHPWFTAQEKRTILLSWARDELVLEQVANGILPELKPRSRIDAVVEALSRFDPRAAAEYGAAADAIRARKLRRAGSRLARLRARRA